MSKFLAPLLLGLTGFPEIALAGRSTVEDKVWTLPAAELPALEGETVRLIQEAPQSAYAHYVVALYYLRQFKADPADLRFLKQASELGQQAIELDPKAEYGYLVAAQVLDLMGYGDNSVDILEPKDNKISKKTWRHSFVKGVLLMEQADISSTLKAFESSLKSPDAPRDVIIPYVKATLQDTDDMHELTKNLISWNERYPHYVFQQGLASAYFSDKRYKEAHEVHKKIRAEHPELLDNQVADAILLYSHLNQKAEAERLFTQVIHSPKAEGKILRTAKAHLGAIALEKKEMTKARRAFVDVITEANDPIEWISFAHKSYESSKQLGEFVSLLDDLRGEMPGTSYLYALQGEILSEGLSDHQRAVASFADAILLDPKRSEFYNGMGLAYYRMNQHAQALNTFHKALSIDPKDATARYNQACVLSIMGRSDEAIDSLKEAIALDTRLQELASKDGDFANIRAKEEFQSLVHTQKTTRVP